REEVELRLAREVVERLLILEREREALIVDVHALRDEIERGALELRDLLHVVERGARDVLERAELLRDRVGGIEPELAALNRGLLGTDRLRRRRARRRRARPERRNLIRDVLLKEIVPRPLNVVLFAPRGFPGEP